MLIREALESDIPFIHEMRNDYILNSTATVNWRMRTLEETTEWFNQTRGKYPFIIAESEDERAGYAALCPFRAADGYARTAEVTVYVHPRHFGKGLGHAMLQKLCADAPDYGLHCLMSVIVADNNVSVNLHEKCGFKVKCTLEEATIKNGQYLDIIFMQKLI